MGGGGIYAAQGNVTVSGGQVKANTAFSSGGGIFALAGNVNLTAGALVMTNSSWGNGGGVYDHATTHTQGVNITDATVAGNVAEFHGGGVFVSTGTISVLDSAIFSNFADRRTGGGLDDNDAAGGVSVTNSTIGSNFTKVEGGGINSAGTATINNSTVVSNVLFIDGKGAGIHATGTIGIDNTIVAGNFDEPTATQHDISGTATGSNNVIGNAGSAGGLVNGHSGNIVGLNGTGTRPVNAIINTTLANHGRSEQTPYSLAFGSVALAAGNSALNPPSVGNYDQRGPGFPRTVNGSMDIGAVEGEPGLAPRSPREPASRS